MQNIWIFIGLIFSAFGNSAYAQNNYVPNGNFEIIDTCPGSPLNPYRSIYYAKPWFQPYAPYNSSDLFNACDTTSNSLGVPDNGGGHQFAQDGVGYAGIAVGSNGVNVREYLEVELLYAMQAGRKYCISLYASLAEWGMYAIDNIQGHFSVNSYYYYNPPLGLLNFSPDFKSTPGVILIDSINWIRISDSFIATGGEKYLLIGNFMSDSINTSIVKKPGAPPYAYYFIDNIQIYDCDSITTVNSLPQPFIINVSPNPAKNQTTIEFTGYGETILEVYFSDGRLLLTRKENWTYDKNEVQLETTEYENGLYYLKINSGDKVGSAKLMIIH